MHVQCHALMISGKNYNPFEGQYPRGSLPKPASWLAGHNNTCEVAAVWCGRRACQLVSVGQHTTRAARQYLLRRVLSSASKAAVSIHAGVHCLQHARADSSYQHRHKSSCQRRSSPHIRPSTGFCAHNLPSSIDNCANHYHQHADNRQQAVHARVKPAYAVHYCLHSSIRNSKKKDEEENESKCRTLAHGRISDSTIKSLTHLFGLVVQ